MLFIVDEETEGQEQKVSQENWIPPWELEKDGIKMKKLTVFASLDACSESLSIKSSHHFSCQTQFFKQYFPLHGRIYEDLYRFSLWGMGREAAWGNR